MRFRSLQCAALVGLLAVGLADLVPCVATGVAPSGGPVAGGDVVAEANASNDSALRDRIQKAIRRLGAVDFDERETARREIESLGALAWDALSIAVRDTDLEVSLQAKYLLRQLLVTGPRPEDPHESHSHLDRFAEQTEQERLRRVRVLAKISDPAIVRSLARIVQLEESESVSRHAAIAVLRRPVPPKRIDRQRLAGTVEDVAWRGERLGLHWLRAYAQTLKSPHQIVPNWSALLEVQDTGVGSGPPWTGGDSAAARGANRAMLQWYTESLQRLGLRRESERAMLIFVNQLPRDGSVSLEVVDWLIQRRGWAALQDLERRFTLTNSDADYGYRLVDAARQRGEFAAAERMTVKLLNRATVAISDRLQVGNSLVERNLEDLAGREYDRALEASDLPDLHRIYLLAAKASMYRSLGDIENCASHYRLALVASEGADLPPDDDRVLRQTRLHVRVQFAEMLHDQGQYQAAAETLKPLAEPAEDDAQDVEQLTDVLELFPRARREYYWSEDARRQNQSAKQLQHLTTGLKVAPEDVDILIALFRLPEYPEHAAVRQTIRRVAQQMRSEISDRMKLLNRELPNTPDVREISDDLAKSLNAYAWLIASTEGDLDDALACSHRSLEIQPNQAGYMDTLARCYFAKKDWVQALLHQENAVELDPYSGQMNAQLTLFQQFVPVLERAPRPSP